ncbi:MAG TPA: TIR domain-containing protein [Pyrinomonadaceae bacterium]|jgi:hypothetical protein|nr:TIR domain-containing protein [Pyrinomonadaceae bacterium]
MSQPAAGQFSGIFISYRRDDSSGHAGRLFDRLSARFGVEQVFMDIDQIEPGEDFVQVIESAVGSCEVLIALIGRNWLASRDESGRRLDNPNDFVRLEIAVALVRGIPVIPVLVQGANMPRPQDLPENLLTLSRRHALELSDLRWKHDVDQLTGVLEKILTRQREARRNATQADEQRRLEAQRQQMEEQARQLEEARRESEVGARLKREAEEAEARQRRESEDRRVATAEQGELARAEQSRRNAGTAEGQPAVNTAPATKGEHASAAHSAPPLRSIVEATTQLKKKSLPKKSRRILLLGVIVLLFVVVSEVYLLLWAQRVRVGDRATNNPPATPEGSSISAIATSESQIGREMTTTTNVNVRSGPGRTYNRIGELGTGSRIRVLQVSDNWAEVEVLQVMEIPGGGEPVTRGWIGITWLR